MTTKLIALALLVAAIAAWLAALWLPCEVRERITLGGIAIGDR